MKDSAYAIISESRLEIASTEQLCGMIENLGQSSMALKAYFAQSETIPLRVLCTLNHYSTIRSLNLDC